jgi:hypothetical protein
MTVTKAPLRHAAETRHLRRKKCTLHHQMPPLTSYCSKNDAPKRVRDTKCAAII